MTRVPILVLGLAAACGSPDPAPDPAPAAGRELARGIVHATEAAHELAEPYRCARLDGDPPAAAAAGRLRIEGHTLRLDARDDASVRVAFVGDSRGASASTLARARALGKQLAADHAQLIVSLGGLGSSREELVAVLSALADSRIPIVAVPGDREPLPAHRAAIAELAGAGIAIADGSAVRLIVAGDVAAIATLPGAPAIEQLVAGSEGCVRGDDDAAAIARELAGTPARVKVWTSHAPARQESDAASDVGRSGVHVGELALVAPVRESGARLAVHALVDEVAFGPAAGELGQSQRGSIGTGPLDAIPIRRSQGSVGGGVAVLASISPAGAIQWRRVSASSSD